MLYEVITIDLVLAAPIYNTDKITVSWQDGKIRSVDGRDLVPFTNIPVKMYVVNILVITSYSIHYTKLYDQRTSICCRWNSSRRRPTLKQQ